MSIDLYTWTRLAHFLLGFQVFCCAMAVLAWAVIALWSGNLMAIWPLLGMALLGHFGLWAREKIEEEL